ncbi:MAG: acetyl-CoA carboxylase carboxyl transferase subunit beta [Candidatus Omnitrophota bacterium]|nr:MAG: acetyl-CoA carboxylase carboxyl transferase subunit beta [Candidatus Omnitrophota bacterium]
MPLFKKKPKYTIVRVKKKDIPDGLWTKCPECNHPIFNKALAVNQMVCPRCNFHFPLGVYPRVELLLDKGTFRELDKEMASLDPLEFRGVRSYQEKIVQDQKATGLIEAAIYGEGKIGGKPVVFSATDSRFIMGSMGSVVGEKITRAAELALTTKKPLVIVSGSGGGARMYEGVFSLMQMAKTSSAIYKLREADIPYISVLTHPTMAGVLASFAGLGDIMIAEPKALIGFTGPRVIEQTIRQKLPQGFQRSEFNLSCGLIDKVVPRKELRNTLIKLLDYLAHNL